MKDTIFIQFYSRIENTNPRYKGHSIYELCNGFSDTYDLCKSKGDFIWINHSKQLKGFGSDRDDIVVELPIDKGTAYVSTYYLSQLYQVLKWAEQYPNIHFMAGGPAANYDVFELPDDFVLPPNMFITELTVEQFFGVDNFSHKWKLELPDDDESMTLSYTYTLCSRCYWGKCIFCNYSQGGRIRKNIGFEYLNVKYNGRQRINLYTPSMTSRQLVEILGSVPYNPNVRYDIYLRGNDMERYTLEEIFKYRDDKFPQVKFIVGAEFPTERMLKYIQKNVTVKGIIDIVNMIANYAHEDIQVQLPFILGWNNLVSNDIKELELFFKQLPFDKVKITFSANLLVAKLHTPVYDTYEKQEDLTVGPFRYGFTPKISKEQLKLSQAALEVMFDQGVTVFDYYNIRGM